MASKSTEAAVESVTQARNPDAVYRSTGRPMTEAMGEARKSPRRHEIVLIGDAMTGKTEFIRTARLLCPDNADHSLWFNDVGLYVQFKNFALVEVMEGTSGFARFRPTAKAILSFERLRPDVAPAADPDARSIRVYTTLELGALRGSLAECYFVCDPTGLVHVGAILRAILGPLGCSVE
jgi:hypothetical protein